VVDLNGQKLPAKALTPLHRYLNFLVPIGGGFSPARARPSGTSPTTQAFAFFSVR
jgi:hypothetical protein